MVIGFYKNARRVDNNNDFNIVGCEDTNEFLYASSSSISEALAYLQTTKGWTKDGSVGRCIFTISEETHPEYFI